MKYSSTDMHSPNNNVGKEIWKNKTDLHEKMNATRFLQMLVTATNGTNQPLLFVALVYNTICLNPINKIEKTKKT